MRFVLESFQSILLLDSLKYQPSVGLAHLCLGLSSLTLTKDEKYKNSMSLKKVEEIVYTLDINTQGKWNEQLLFYIQKNKSDICKAHTNTLQHILSHY